jgi:predicted CoA-substrate-specific enzyme activase
MSDRMLRAGCDIGSASVKWVLIGSEGIIRYTVLPYKGSPRDAAIRACHTICGDCGVAKEDFAFTATGLGKAVLEDACGQASESRCLWRLCAEQMPNVRTIIDLGCHTSRALRFGEAGQILDIAESTACASGTGLFLESMARALELSFTALNQQARRSQNPSAVTTQCAVFAESEVISLVNGGESVRDVCAGIVRSIALNALTLYTNCQGRPPVALCGGVSTIEAVRIALARELGHAFIAPPFDRRIAAAYGAALLTPASDG